MAKGIKDHNKKQNSPARQWRRREASGAVSGVSKHAGGRKQAPTVARKAPQQPKPSKIIKRILTALQHGGNLIGNKVQGFNVVMANGRRIVLPVAGKPLSDIVKDLYKSLIIFYNKSAKRFDLTVAGAATLHALAR